MVQIDIGTINIDIVAQASSVNFGNTLNVEEKLISPDPDQDRTPEVILSPDQKSAERVKKRIQTAGRRRRGGDFPLRSKAFPPGMMPFFVPVPGWIPNPFFPW